METPRRSAVAEVDTSGSLVRLDLAGDDDEVLETLGPGPALLVVDAPLVVANEGGRRDVEALLAWCDVPLFPVSRRRLAQVMGGLRGADLAPCLGAEGREAWETAPDLVLRQLMWEERGDPDAPPPDMAAYRTAWLGVRAPAFRAKGAGRARPQGFAEAHALLARQIDLGGWAPASRPDEWQALHDAARLDALACAALALRRSQAPERTMALGTPERGRMLVPVDRSLRERIEVNLARLRAEGAVAI